jgi:hypothetical protein
MQIMLGNYKPQIHHKNYVVLGFSRLEFKVQLLLSGLMRVECGKLSNVSIRRVAERSSTLLISSIVS